MLQHLNPAETEVLERAIDFFLLNLPEDLASWFELDSHLLYFTVEDLRPWDDREATVLIVECPNSDICKLMIRNLQKVARAAATCGIRYFSISESGDTALIYQSLFDTPSSYADKN